MWILIFSVHVCFDLIIVCSGDGGSPPSRTAGSIHGSWIRGNFFSRQGIDSGNASKDSCCQKRAWNSFWTRPHKRNLRWPKIPGKKCSWLKLNHFFLESLIDDVLSIIYMYPHACIVAWVYHRRGRVAKSSPKRTWPRFTSANWTTFVGRNGRLRRRNVKFVTNERRHKPNNHIDRFGRTWLLITSTLLLSARNLDCRTIMIKMKKEILCHSCTLLLANTSGQKEKKRYMAYQLNVSCTMNWIYLP